jgi:hypothetical protein
MTSAGTSYCKAMEHTTAASHENFAKLAALDRAGDGETQPPTFDVEVCGCPTKREVTTLAHGALRSRKSGKSGQWAKGSAGGATSASDS